MVEHLVGAEPRRRCLAAQLDVAPGRAGARVVVAGGDAGHMRAVAVAHAPGVAGVAAGRQAEEEVEGVVTEVAGGDDLAGGDRRALECRHALGEAPRHRRREPGDAEAWGGRVGQERGGGVDPGIDDADLDPLAGIGEAVGQAGGRLGRRDRVDLARGDVHRGVVHLLGEDLGDARNGLQPAE